jgi:hypothetical protein
MSLEMLTRTEDIRRNVLNNTGNAVVRSGSWVSRDANGNAKTPSGGEVAAGVAQLVILGSENARPDSLGSESVTVQYGQNRFAVGVEGFVPTSIVVGSELELSTTVSGASELGYKLKIKGSATTVAICEDVSATRLVFRTLR